MDACNRHTCEGNRSDCFVSFGLDSNRVETYYRVVEGLEENYQKGKCYGVSKGVLKLEMFALLGRVSFDSFIIKQIIYSDSH